MIFIFAIFDNIDNILMIHVKNYLLLSLTLLIMMQST